MPGVRGTGVPVGGSNELLQRLQACERALGIGNNDPTSQVFRDANGLVRLTVGNLPSGDVGLETRDPAGVRNEIWPISCAQAAGGTSSTAAGTPGNLAAGGASPTVTCYLGESGDALITVSCAISPPAGGGLGQVYFVVDGNNSNGAWLIFEAQLSSGADSGASCSISQRLSQSNTTYFQNLTPNAEHTFSLKYAGTSVSFGGVCITIQPL